MNCRTFRACQVLSNATEKIEKFLPQSKLFVREIEKEEKRIFVKIQSFLTAAHQGHWRHRIDLKFDM